MPPRVGTAAVGLALALVVAVGTGACGGEPPDFPAAPEGVDRVIDIEMFDIRFEPKELTVEAGTTVAFRFRNQGRVTHEAVIGDAALQEAVAGGADRPAETVVAGRGRAGVVVYRFDGAGPVIIGCHLPGHYAAGMRVSVTVR